MLSRFATLRGLVTPLVTLAVLGAIFGLYYLHVRSQAAKFDNRNMRRLATLSRQVESTVRGYADAVRTLYKNDPAQVQLDLKQFLEEQTDLTLDDPSPTHAGIPPA
jgi:hypothetical protein